MLQVALRTVALLAEDLKRLHEHASLCEANLSVILLAEGVRSRASHCGTDDRTAGCNHRGEDQFLAHERICSMAAFTPVKRNPIRLAVPGFGPQTDLKMQERFHSQHTSSKNLLSVRRHGNCIIAELFL